MAAGQQGSPQSRRVGWWGEGAKGLCTSLREATDDDALAGRAGVDLSLDQRVDVGHALLDARRVLPQLLNRQPWYVVPAQTHTFALHSC